MFSRPGRVKIGNVPPFQLTSVPFVENPVEFVTKSMKFVTRDNLHLWNPFITFIGRILGKLSLFTEYFSSRLFVT